MLFESTHQSIQHCLYVLTVNGSDGYVNQLVYTEFSWHNKGTYKEAWDTSRF